MPLSTSELIPENVIKEEIALLEQSGKTVRNFEVMAWICPNCKDISEVFICPQCGDKHVYCSIEVLTDSSWEERIRAYSLSHHKFYGPWMTASEFFEEESTETE